MEKYLLKLKRNLSKLKKYFDHYDIVYKGTRDVRYLFDLSIDEDYYKLITNISAFNGNYIEYETKGDKDKISSIKEYLDMISSDINEVIRPVLNLFFYDKIS